MVSQNWAVNVFAAILREIITCIKRNQRFKYVWQTEHNCHAVNKTIHYIITALLLSCIRSQTYVSEVHFTLSRFSSLAVHVTFTEGEGGGEREREHFLKSKTPADRQIGDR